jgi:3-dehydroquinate dehydratase-2
MSDAIKGRILVIHGPNLNLLGEREPEVYGSTTLADLDGELRAWGEFHGFEIQCEQSNSEGEIIDWLHRWGRPDKEYTQGARGIVLNPAGYTHTSVAIRDAIAAIPSPVVEVHISNIHAREDFRARSLTAPACLGVIGGFGTASYLVALDALRRHLEEQEQASS